MRSPSPQATEAFEESLAAALLRAEDFALREAMVAALAELVRLPSIAGDQSRAADVIETAELVRSLLLDAGVSARLISPPGGGAPVVWAEHCASPEMPTITIYGHYDVQPAHTSDGWSGNPFVPRIEDGRMHGRGTADSKGNIVAVIAALQCAREVGGPPVNIRLLFEGEEESGGTGLSRLVAAYREELQTDYVVLWDGGFQEGHKPALGRNLRGLLYVEVEAQGGRHDVHSGQYGGVAPNPLTALTQIIGALKDRNARITIPGYYDGVAPPSTSDLATSDLLPEYADRLCEDLGVSQLDGEAEYAPVFRQTSRPTLDVHGIRGGYVGDGAKTVIPSSASAKISMRLVKNQNPTAIAAALDAYLAELCPPGIGLTTRVLAAIPPVELAADHPLTRSLATAMETTFATDVLWSAGGGTIPIAATFREEIAAPVITAGIIGENSNIHGSNESLQLSDMHEGAKALLRFFWSAASTYEPG